MRQPPSPLLLSARKRRPRRNPPRGQFSGQLGGGPAAGEAGQQQQAADEKCALLERSPGYSAPVPQPDDDDSTASSR